MTDVLPRYARPTLETDRRTADTVPLLAAGAAPAERMRRPRCREITDHRTDADDAVLTRIGPLGRTP